MGDKQIYHHYFFPLLFWKLKVTKKQQKNTSRKERKKIQELGTENKHERRDAYYYNYKNPMR